MRLTGEDKQNLCLRQKQSLAYLIGRSGEVGRVVYIIIIGYTFHDRLLVFTNAEKKPEARARQQ